MTAELEEWVRLVLTRNWVLLPFGGPAGRIYIVYLADRSPGIIVILKA